MPHHEKKERPPSLEQRLARLELMQRQNGEKLEEAVAVLKSLRKRLEKRRRRRTADLSSEQRAEEREEDDTIPPLD